MKKIIYILLVITCIAAGCGSSGTILEDLEISPNDTIVKVVTEKDTTFKDSVVTDTIYKDTLIQDTIIRDTIIRDTIIRDTIINEVIIVDTIIVTRGYYNNPIINMSLPDPTVIRAKDYNYYLFATEDIRNTPIYKSKNLINWEFVGTAFTDETRPSINNGNLWAPDINYVNGKYYLYYSQSTWGGEWTCGIGVAVSDKPEGPYHDHGKLFTSREIGVQNSIDPYFMEDDGKKYLFWGSNRGIFGIELSDDGLSIRKGATVSKIAAEIMEGCYIHKRDGYYYLFGSRGSCCNGVNSSYHVILGRATNLFGPYTNRNGESMLSGAFDVFLKGNDYVKGPGHNSKFVKDDKGQDWMIYHGYLNKEASTRRITFLDQVKWTNDGWPYIDNDSPSEKAIKPIIAE
jgi:beta-xylosidase